MYDYGLSVLEQYGLSAVRSWRGRGALLCQTQNGLVMIREFNGSETKLKYQRALLQKIQESRICRTDYLFPTLEGDLVARDKDGAAYTLRRWYEGRECDTKSREDILRSVRALADLHKGMRLEFQENYAARSQREEYQRHNRELRKIQKFIRKKKAENDFEKMYALSARWFLEKAAEATERLENSGYRELLEESRKQGCICHGEFNQHNVLFTENGIAVTNFEHWCYDIQMADLYRFMRKILEKYNWNLELAQEMVTAYQERKEITRGEMENLKLRFQYPEKYWKLANYYFSHKKIWISEKNVEKLRILVKQREVWEDFGEKCFKKFLF